MKNADPIRSLPKKIFAQYIWLTHSRWQLILNPVVSSNDTTYKTWLAYLQKSKRYIYVIHHHLSLNWCPRV
jgi:hypothetical protein